MSVAAPAPDAVLSAGAPAAPPGVLRESGVFLLYHLPHLLIAPCMALTVVTFLHELAHSAAALVQGATVTTFVFLPGKENFGHMNYTVPEGAFVIDELVSLAPYLMWGTAAAFAAFVAAFRPRLPYAFSSSIFVWFYVVPLLDIANAVQGWLFGAKNDLAHAIGRATILDALLVLLAAPVIFVASWFVQRGLYGKENALSPAAYVLVSTLAVLALGAFMLLLSIAMSLT